MSTLVAFRLPTQLLNKIDKITKQIHRSKSYLIRKALDVYVKEYADYQIALDRLNDKDDEIITSKEMRKRLNV